jgi:hypothetical protein
MGAVYRLGPPRAALVSVWKLSVLVAGTPDAARCTTARGIRVVPKPFVLAGFVEARLSPVCRGVHQQIRPRAKATRPAAASHDQREAHLQPHLAARRSTLTRSIGPICAGHIATDVQLQYEQLPSCEGSPNAVPGRIARPYIIHPTTHRPFHNGYLDHDAFIGARLAINVPLAVNGSALKLGTDDDSRAKLEVVMR